MKLSLLILVFVGIVASLTGLANSQTINANKTEGEAGPGNATNSSAEFQKATILSVTTVPTTTDGPTTTNATPTTTTTAIPTTPSTTTAASTSLPTTSAKTTIITESTTTTTKPTTTKSPPAAGGRRFDAPSFFGGIILAFGLLAICYVAFKFYRSRTEHNYHSLQETVHM